MMKLNFLIMGKVVASYMQLFMIAVAIMAAIVIACNWLNLVRYPLDLRLLINIVAVLLYFSYIEWKT